MYRLINCVVRYTRSVTTTKKTKGAFFHSRVSQTLPKNLNGRIWDAVLVFINGNVVNPENITKSFQPFSAFSREPEETPDDEDPNKIFDTLWDVFDPACLKTYAPQMHWNSNIFCPVWNPNSVKGISSEAPNRDHVIWTGDCLTQNSPHRFRKWVQKVLKPQEEPMALLLHVLNHIGVVKGSDFYAYNSIDYVLSRLMTPRYFT
jgi:hypothetical protein